MVVKADKMQHAVDDDPMQFALVGAPKGDGILLDTVCADAELARQNGFTIGQGEGYDVGIEIVTETLFVDVQQLVVATEIVVQLPYRFAVLLRHLRNPRFGLLRVDGWHLHVECVESDHLYCVFFFK